MLTTIISVTIFLVAGISLGCHLEGMKEGIRVGEGRHEKLAAQVREIKMGMEVEREQNVSCEECGVILKKYKAEKVILTECVGPTLDLFRRNLYFCQSHQKPYDEIVVGGLTRTLPRRYFKRGEGQRIEVNKKGKKLKNK